MSERLETENRLLKRLVWCLLSNGAESAPRGALVIQPAMLEAAPAEPELALTRHCDGTVEVKSA